jgi:hypothetical protein
MHTTHLIGTLASHASRFLSSLAGLACVSVWIVGGTAGEASATSPGSVPHVLDGVVAETIAEVRGGVTCSGTPIDGTAYVATAAHCVIDGQGNVRNRTVVRDGVEYESVAVLVDTRYHRQRTAQLDAAVLVMEHPIPGPAATPARALPAEGRVTLAGFQPVDSAGKRGLSPSDRLPTGCEQLATSITVTASRVRLACGLVQGASGGGLFQATGGAVELLGILSRVTSDGDNILVPLRQLWLLLDHPEIYRHNPASTAPARASVAVS